MRHEDLDFLQTELSRVSNWIQFTDQKAGFIAVFYSAILGYLVSKRDEVLSHLFFCSQDCDIWVLIFFVSIFFLWLGVYHLFLTVLPKLKNTNAKGSLFFFGSIATMKLGDYLVKFENLNDEEARNQLKEQIYTNSIIANSKMVSVQKSTKFLFWSGLLVFMLFII